MPKFGQFKFGLEDFGSYTTTTTVDRNRVLGDTFYSDRDVVQLPAGKRSIVLASSITGEEDENKQAIITALQSIGGILKKGINVTTQAVKDALKEVIASYELKFYIQDDNGNWIDFTDRAEAHGRNQLRKLGSISYSAERLRGELQQKLGSLTLDNTDNFWDKPFPTLQSTYNEAWKPYVTNASFSSSYNSKETSIYRNKAAVRANVRLRGQEVEESLIMGVFLIDDVATDHKSRAATLKFVPISQVLTEDKLQNFKDGKSYYENRDVIFLLKEILKRTLANSAGDVPSTFDIDNIQSSVPAESQKQGWVTSRLGPAPTYVNDGSTTEYTKDMRDIGAVETWYYDTGTISITKGSNVISGSGTGWKEDGSSGATGNNRIHVGDCLAISKEFYEPHASSGQDGGSQVGGAGYYEILAIDDSAQTITLDRAPDVSASVSSINYAVVRVYIGKGSDLYEYNPATSIYRRLTTSSATIGGSSLNYTIKRLFINDVHTEWLIYGVAATEPSTARSSHYNRTGKVFRFKWASSTPTIEVDDTNEFQIDLADYVYRESDYIETGVSGYKGQFVGGFRGAGSNNLISNGSSPRGQSVAIPFKQTVRDVRATGGTVRASAHAEDFDQGWGNGVLPYSVDWMSSTVTNTRHFNNHTRELEVGHWSLRAGPFATTADVVQGWAFTARYQLGNTGFCTLYRDDGLNALKGKILFVRKQKPTYNDSDDRDESSSVHDAKLWEYTYHCYNVAQFDTSNAIVDLTGIDTLNASNGNHGSLKHFIPTAVDIKVDPSNANNDRVYISFVRITNALRKVNIGDDDTGTNYNLVVYEFENFLDANTRVARQIYNLGRTYENTDAYWVGIHDPMRIPFFNLPFPTEIKHVSTTLADGTAKSYLYLASLDLNNTWGNATGNPSNAVLTDKRPFGYRLDRLDTSGTVGSTTTPALTNIVKDGSPIQGLTSLPFSYSSGSSYRSTNTLFYHKTSSNTYEMVDVDLGSPYGQTSQDGQVFIAETVSQKSHVFGLTASIPSIMEIYWIGSSSPSQVEQLTTSDLLRLSAVEQVNVELAQFESMSSWQAISLMAEMCNAVFGFKPDGNFFFKRRIKSESPTYTFTSVGDSSVLALQKGRGQNLIANHISKFPRLIKRGEIDFKVEIGRDSTYGKDEYAHDFNIRQKDDAAKSVTLVCTEAGNIRSSASAPIGAEFKYRINEPMFETALSANYTTSSYVLPVTSTTDVTYAAYVKVIGKDVTNEEIRKEGRVGLPVAFSGGLSLQVKEEASDTVTRITTKLSDGSSASSLSTAAVTNAGRALKTNDLLLIGNSTGQNQEYVRILGIDSDALIVQRNALGHTNAKSHAVGESIKLISSLSEIFLYEALSTASSDTFVTNDRVEVRPVFYDLDSMAFKEDPLASSPTTTAIATLKPINNQWIAIGGPDTLYSSHVSIKLSYATADEVVEDDDGNEGPNEGLSFAVGDRIEITCKGVSLEQDAASVHIEVDTSSIERWGKRESSKQSNPLFSRYQARRAAKRELTEFAHPRWVFKVSTPITPWISLLDVVDLQFEEMLPKSKQFKETCYINNITYDLQNSGLATLTLVSVDPY